MEQISLPKIEQALRDLVNATIASGAGGGTHNLLSAAHPDTTAAPVSAGDIIVGDSTPKWVRLAKGTAGHVLKAGATLVSWGQVAFSELTGALGAGQHGSLADGDHTGNLSGVARTTVRKNSGSNVGSRRRLNFIEGANVTLTVADDAANEEVDVTIAAAGGGGAAAGLWSSIGQTSRNNATTPATQYDLNADAVILRNASNEIVVRYNPGVRTNNVLTAGPAANGRDQSGTFGPSTWIHFYWIWDGTTLATISSLTPPPTGPTLPSGYTHWAYAGAVRYDATPALVRTRIRGNYAFYEGQVLVLSGGTATTETGVTISGAVPPNATEFVVQAAGYVTASIEYQLRVVSGTNHYSHTILIDTTATSQVRLGHTGSLFYLWGGAGGFLTLHVMGYTLPNGGG